MQLDRATCYAALCSRDRRFDGRFFVGVRTTGIYCRSICPAPTPKLENVTFYACAAAAEAAGFRPCRRCRPEAAPGTPAWAGSGAVVARALRLINAGALDADGSEALAARLGMGPRQLRRLFERHLGASPVAVARARRVHIARALLDDCALPITAVACAAGFRSLRQFNHAIRATFGAPPRALRRRRQDGVGHDANGLHLRLTYRPPLEWTALTVFLAARAIPGVEAVVDATYRRTIAVDGAIGWLEVAPSATEAALSLRLHLDAPGAMLAAIGRVRRLFDLDADPLQIARHLARAPLLRPLVRAAPGRRVPGAWDPFETAVRAILGQQVTVRAATTLAGRLAARFGTPIAAGGGLERVFPSAAVLATADVEVIGLPRARAETIRALAAAVRSGAVVLDSADPAATIAQLMTIPGIGPWTAQYIAMRALGDPDAFPCGDLGVRKALGNGAGPVSPAAAEALAEPWRPWRAYAVMHLWNAPAPVQATGPAAAPRAAQLEVARR